jgi:hypothetical protein
MQNGIICLNFGWKNVGTPAILGRALVALCPWARPYLLLSTRSMGNPLAANKVMLIVGIPIIGQKLSIFGTRSVVTSFSPNQDSIYHWVLPLRYWDKIFPKMAVSCSRGASSKTRYMSCMCRIFIRENVISEYSASSNGLLKGFLTIDCWIFY